LYCVNFLFVSVRKLDVCQATADEITAETGNKVSRVAYSAATAYSTATAYLTKKFE